MPRSRLPLRLGRDLPAHLDAAALAAILVAATDGLKDLSDILDPPSRARRGFEQRMQHLTELVEALRESPRSRTSSGSLSG